MRPEQNGLVKDDCAIELFPFYLDQGSRELVHKPRRRDSLTSELRSPNLRNTQSSPAYQSQYLSRPGKGSEKGNSAWDGSGIESRAVVS